MTLPTNYCRKQNNRNNMKKMIKVTTVYGGQKVTAVNVTKGITTRPAKKMVAKAAKKPQEDIVTKMEKMVKKMKPVVMVYSNDAKGKPGPYCQVKIPYQGHITTTIGQREVTTGEGPDAKTRLEPILGTKRLRGIPVKVRVVKGDDLNGEGFVVEPDQRIPAYRYGAPIAWAGGTKLSLARAKVDLQVNPFSA
jgi:hypothetical protein